MRQQPGLFGVPNSPFRSRAIIARDEIAYFEVIEGEIS
jgi:hypothetical protein